MQRIDALTAKGLIRLGNGQVVAKSEAAANLAAARKPSPAKPGTSTAKASSDADRASGRDTERKRWATVFGHDASKGQERLAAHLLSQPQRFAASDIIAALCSSEMGRNASAPASTKQAASTPDCGKAASWDDVHAEILICTGRA